MGAFELQPETTRVVEPEEVTTVSGHRPPPPKIKDECIVAYKVYDSCRRQNCLTHKELGAPLQLNPEEPTEPEVPTEMLTEQPKPELPVEPPLGAASVDIKGLKIAKINIGAKKPNPFRAGYWDVEVKYDFEYTLIFSDAAGKEIKEEEAKSSFKTKTTMFGSIDSEPPPEKNHTGTGIFPPPPHINV